MPPYTGVNFIVYAGRATKSAGVQPIDSLAPKSNLEMVLQRIELSTDAEEIKMLKEQLATLKENHA